MLCQVFQLKTASQPPMSFLLLFAIMVFMENGYNEEKSSKKSNKYNNDGKKAEAQNNHRYSSLPCGTKPPATHVNAHISNEPDNAHRLPILFIATHDNV